MAEREGEENTRGSTKSPGAILNVRRTAPEGARAWIARVIPLRSLPKYQAKPRTGAFFMAEREGVENTRGST